jgi:hypothetical protein
MSTTRSSCCCGNSDLPKPQRGQAQPYLAGAGILSITATKAAGSRPRSCNSNATSRICTATQRAGKPLGDANNFQDFLGCHFALGPQLVGMQTHQPGVRSGGALSRRHCARPANAPYPGAHHPDPAFRREIPSASLTTFENDTPLQHETLRKRHGKSRHQGGISRIEHTKYHYMLIYCH